MSRLPPDERSGPPPQRPAPKTLDAPQRSRIRAQYRSGGPRQPARCRHLRVVAPVVPWAELRQHPGLSRGFVAELRQRRKNSAELDELLDRLYPTPPSRPETFGLSDDQILAEAHRLRDAGFSAWEISALLARPSGAA